MILRLPDYYKEFHCIAEKCKDSCCIGWEIDIDEETLEYYKSIPGAFGRRLKENMIEGEETSFALHKGRCAFLNEKNLCDICTELGETSLCEICLEYPRFTVEYGAVREKCLGLSCEEAGRLIFEKDTSMCLEETVLEEQYQWKEEEEEYEVCEGEMDDTQYPFLETARDYVLELLKNREKNIEERAKGIILFASIVQNKMNEGDFSDIGQVIEEYRSCIEAGKKEEPPDSVWQERFRLYQARMDVYEELELLDKEWDTVFREMKEQYKDTASYKQMQKEFIAHYTRKDIEYEHLLVYFVFRYGMKAVYDCNFLEKIQFSIVSFLVIRDMDALCFQKKGRFGLEERIDMARIYSKEVEHSEDNLEMLAEACVFEESFSVESLGKSI